MEGEDGGVLTPLADTLLPPPSGYACHLPLAGED